MGGVLVLRPGDGNLKEMRRGGEDLLLAGICCSKAAWIGCTACLRSGTDHVSSLNVLDYFFSFFAFSFTQALLFTLQCFLI